MDGTNLSELVETALERFFDEPLDVAALRAYRIARLRGDVDEAVRLHLETRPTGMPQEDRVKSVQAIYPGFTYDEVRERFRGALESFIEARQPLSRRMSGDDEPSMHIGSITELLHYLEFARTMTARADDFVDPAQWGEALQTQADRIEVVERIRAWVYDYLVRVEAQLEASDPIMQALVAHRATVDRALHESAPEILDQLGAALRTAKTGGSEERAQVLTTCRRVVQRIADAVFPPRAEPFTGSDGVERQVGATQYRNRIVAAVDSQSTEGRAFTTAASEFAIRLDRLDDLLNKGVHDDITEHEMRFGLAQTYFLCGELIRLGSSNPPE